MFFYRMRLPAVKIYHASAKKMRYFCDSNALHYVFHKRLCIGSKIFFGAGVLKIYHKHGIAATPHSPYLYKKINCMDKYPKCY
jgi:hypothetical protein